MVVYVLLSGSPPFWHDDTFKLFEQIRKCQYDFNSDSFDNVSDEAKDFISKLLVADPSKRMDCEQMMEHPWMKLELTDKV